MSGFLDRALIGCETDCLVSLLDRWSELLAVLGRRKLRTGLTALSVAWGVFMLVILLAAGNGLANGVQAAFAEDAVNSVWINPGVVSKAHRGSPIGKRIQLYDDDVPFVQGNMPAAQTMDARFSAGERVISRGQRRRRSEIRGCLPGRAEVHEMIMKAGRFINEDDVRGRRRVAVVEQKVVDSLFTPGEDPIGAFIQAGSSPLQIVGVFEEAEDESEQGMVNIPLPVAQLIFGGGSRINQITFLVNTPTKQTESLIDGLRAAFGGRKGFAPSDQRAMRVNSRQELYDKLNGLFAGIRAFVWLIGLGTIMAGIVAVGNIMLISVSERTREIGVRKAVGAPPAAIIRMIVEEALVLTLVSGYLGLVAAVAVVHVAAQTLPRTEYFSQPQVNLGVGLAATGVLALTGILAGLFPALRAARINPIHALRVE
jgi:putative ABC transport system permease protein